MERLENIGCLFCVNKDNSNEDYFTNSDNCDGASMALASLT